MSIIYDALACATKENLKTLVRGINKEKDELITKIEKQQAKIDSLMLEYCPDEMSDKQIEEWEKHQEESK